MPLMIIQKVRIPIRKRAARSGSRRDIWTASIKTNRWFWAVVEWIIESIAELPCLLSIRFGKHSCTSIYSFVLSGLSSLSVLFFADSAFAESRCLQLDSTSVSPLIESDLPSLIMLEFKNGCFENGDLHWKGTPFPLFFSLADLPKLSTFKCGDNCFKKRQLLILKRTRFSFRWVKAFQSLVDFSCGLQSFAFSNLQAVASKPLLPSNEWQICRSWNRFGSAMPRFTTRLSFIWAIWWICAVFRLEIVRFSKSWRCIL